MARRSADRSWRKRTIVDAVKMSRLVEQSRREVSTAPSR
jgi:hypothetical protein